MNEMSVSSYLSQCLNKSSNLGDPLGGGSWKDIFVYRSILTMLHSASIVFLPSYDYFQFKTLHLADFWTTKMASLYQKVFVMWHVLEELISN